MKALLIITLAFTVMNIVDAQDYNSLTDAEREVILKKGTEMPFTGEYENKKEDGTYTCRQCNTALYGSKDKFSSNCGWPSFDDEIEGAVLKFTDADGRRTEIVCANCKGHLGHVFTGEGYTDKDTRHCVNSISLKFIKEGEELPQPIPNTETKIAYLASGCFWGTEYHLQKLPGVISTTVGYLGGTMEHPTYKEVCTGTTGHAEAVKVVYDPQLVSYETILKMYFETHDPTQVDGQGPDIGTQYRSEIFYTELDQKKVAQKLISLLEEKGYKVATALSQAPPFYEAEDYHQDYYDNKGSSPYCHIYKAKF